MTRSLLRSALLGAGLALAAPLAGPALLAPAHATTVVPLTTDQLVDASEFIVVGSVVDVWTERDDSGMIWTRALVEVERGLKGDADSTLVIQQAGGSYGEQIAVVPGVARFSVGERGVFFASTRGEGRIQLIGMAQGKFTIRMDPTLRQEIVQRVSIPISRPYDHRFLPLPSTDDRLTLDDLLDQVQDRVELGWDGQPIPGVLTEKLYMRNKLQAGVK